MQGWTQRFCLLDAQATAPQRSPPQAFQTSSFCEAFPIGAHLGKDSPIPGKLPILTGAALACLQSAPGCDKLPYMFSSNHNYLGGLGSTGLPGLLETLLSSHHGSKSTPLWRRLHCGRASPDLGTLQVQSRPQIQP